METEKKKGQNWVFFFQKNDRLKLYFNC